MTIRDDKQLDWTKQQMVFANLRGDDELWQQYYVAVCEYEERIIVV